jgi:DNA repair exonuclease SbcCD ATPase subunit
MSFFTVGNLLTLGIVALALILFRQLDRHNRSLDKLRKYGDRLKEELTTFIIQKESAVRDYGVELDVHLKAAKELMHRLQVGDADLASKVDLVANLDGKIKTYDTTLGELVRMTVRVQENLNRIKDESTFVEGVGKRVSEAKGKLDQMEQGLSDLELRFERENTESLGSIADSMLSAVRASVSDLQVTAETIERKVEDHREAVTKVEQERVANLSREMDIIEKTLKNAVEQAGLRADKMEEAALVKLRDQAQERVQRFQTAVEEKLQTYQESSKARLAEVQDLANTVKAEWKTDTAEIQSKQQTYKEEWKKDIQELNNQILNTGDEWKKIIAQGNADVRTVENSVKELETYAFGMTAEMERRLKELDGQTTDAVVQMQGCLARTIEEEGQKALEAADAKLEEYRASQAREFERLGSLADDAAKLDAELRRYMQETENRVRQDFALFERDFANTRNSAAAEFAAALDTLRTDVSTVERELGRIKEQSYDTVSDKLKVFEEDFSADLFRRREEFDSRLGKWKDALDTELTELGEESREERRKMETSFREELKRHFADEDARLISELEHLKAEAGAFEEGIRNQMVQADESLDALKNQLDRNLEDARSAAESTVKSELGRFSLAMAENIKQYQREVEGDLKRISILVESRNGEFGDLLEESRHTIDEWQAKFAGQMRDLDASADESRRKVRDMGVETEERITAIRSDIEKLREAAAAQRADAFARTDEQVRALEAAIKDADRRIKEFLIQTKLFDQAEDLKSTLERNIEDLRSDLNGLDQRRAEAADLESKFIKIKRLEEDVDAKMVSFQSEKRRIELMENDFNRLLQTSQSVKEKLTQVTASDDTLQAIQVQIRRLEDALTDTEERYQRIEKKNQTLEETNAGIDENFKALQDADRTVQKVSGEVRKLLEEQGGLRSSLEKLAAENIKAQEAVEKVGSLDSLLSTIEDRMEKMQAAREWLANAETRFGELNKNIQEQFKLVSALLKDEDPGKRRFKERGAPSIATRENVVKLKQRGWTKEEIARNMNISVGEVELILEIGSKG